jgi:hypothetical protein
MMLLKQFFNHHATWLQAGSVVLAPVKSVAQLSVARLKNAVKFEIPDGYQDERGFHFGAEPAPRQNN